jgi:hypothetical protein
MMNFFFFCFFFLWCSLRRCIGWIRSLWIRSLIGGKHTSFSRSFSPPLTNYECTSSVQLLRRIDTRIPPVLLSQYITSMNAQSQTAQPNLGRLGLSTSGLASGGTWRSGIGGAKPVAAAGGGNAWGAKPAATAGAGAGGGSVWGARTVAAVVAGRSGSPVSSGPARGHSPAPATVAASAWGGPATTTSQNQNQTLSGAGGRPASNSPAPAPASAPASSVSGGNVGSTVSATAVPVGGQAVGNVNTGEGEEDVPDNWEDDD